MDKMHNKTACSGLGVRRRGFTLLELPVVIIVIGNW